MLNKQLILEKLQTLSDVVDDHYDNCSVKNAQRLAVLIEECFEAVCRRKA